MCVCFLLLWSALLEVCVRAYGAYVVVVMMVMHESSEDDVVRHRCSRKMDDLVSRCC